MLRVVEEPGRETAIPLDGATRAVVSWNAGAPQGEIALVAHRAGGAASAPLPYVRWSPQERRSLDGGDAATRVRTDVLTSDVPLDALGVRASVALDAVAVTTPPRGRSAPVVQTAVLEVPPISQEVAEQPAQRGWCSVAATAMLLGAWGVHVAVVELAPAIHDAAYGGTGNWAFSVAAAGARGFFGAVAYLDGLDHAAAFVAAGYPLALSIAWRDGELPGAPLARSAGHLVVMRGVDAAQVTVNDPAQPAIVTRYDRAAFDTVFRAHGGVAYVVVPRVRAPDAVALANLAG